MVAIYKNGPILFFSVRVPSMHQNNYVLVVFKVYLAAAMVSARRYSGISKYFRNSFPKHLPFYVGTILSTFAARIRSLKHQPHLGQRRPPSLSPNGVPKFTHPSTQVLLYPVAGGYMI